MTKHFILLSVACTLVCLNSYGAAKPSPTHSKNAPSPGLTELHVATDEVWIGKGDQATSCNADSGVGLDAMGRDLALAGIKFTQKQKLHDANAHIQMCGSDKGVMNVYLIKKSQLPQAQTLGFNEVKRGL